MFHINTRLPDGRPSIIIDPGSVGNLSGDKWAREVAINASKNGLRPSYSKRTKPLRVSGVGNGSQACTYDCNLPVALKHDDGNDVSLGTLSVPTVPNSDLPGLLGLNPLRKNRGVLDLNTLKLYFLGPGDYDLATAMPPGTDCFQCEIAPSGHLALPCSEFSANQDNQSSEHTLTLMSRSQRNGGSSGGQQAEARSQEYRAGTTTTTFSTRSRSMPPPPRMPPVLPAGMEETVQPAPERAPSY